VIHRGSTREGQYAKRERAPRGDGGGTRDSGYEIILAKQPVFG
jgi:hypothetical protein